MLDGYVKHVEVLADKLDESMYETINELASINSSIYWNPPQGADRGTALTFDQAGVATVADPTYAADQAEKLRHNAIGSNLLRMVDDFLCVDDLAYTSPQKIREIPYTKGKRRIAEPGGCIRHAPGGLLPVLRGHTGGLRPAFLAVQNSLRRPTPLLACLWPTGI